jgi:hypothetical protein
MGERNVNDGPWRGLTIVPGSLRFDFDPDGGWTVTAKLRPPPQGDEPEFEPIDWPAIEAAFNEGRPTVLMLDRSEP